MHNYIINASIQLLPIVTQKHPYEWVDKVIEVIAASGLWYEVGPFSTAVEGRYAQVKALVDEINDYLVDNKCTEWLLNVQYQLRAENDMTALEKTGKFR